MNNKLNNMLNDFFEKNEGLDEKNMNEKLQEFIQMYNAGEIEYQNTLLDDAYEVLEIAVYSRVNDRESAVINHIAGSQTELPFVSGQNSASFFHANFPNTLIDIPLLRQCDF